ncbi:hypothetical protein C8A06_1416 [Microbacteriaceae bacterium MWH-Ta3]|nr:hypothetical protein C8A06_1416 [Microbacteriaceae bacterium MWH-Ta3]
MIVYRERLTPPMTFHLALALLLPLGYGMFAPISVIFGIAWAIVLLVAAELWLFVWAPLLVITESEVRAGRATISRSIIGAVTPIARTERRAALHDARSWKLLRAWIPTAVTIDITDPEDPTPFWFVSTRRPERVAEILNAR